MADALTPLGIFAVSSLATRRATPLQVVGVLVGFVGALYTIGVVDGRGIHLSAYGIGDFVIMLSALAWGVYTALGRDDVKRIGPYAFSVWTMLIGAVSMAVLIAAGSALHHLSGEGVHIIAAFVWPCGAKAWALVAFIGFFCTLMPFSAWNAAQKYMPLSVLGMTAYFTPVVAITIDRVIRGRTVTRWQLFGTLLICLSAIVEVGRHRD